MSCAPTKKLCKRLVISQAVTFADDVLTVNLPAGTYSNKEKYCVVIAQNIPETTTIGAPVVFTIGDDTTTYSLLNCDCTPVIACSLNRRTRYSVVVNTNIAGGVFSLIGKLPCSSCVNAIDSLPIADTTT